MTLNVQNPAPVKVGEDPVPYTGQFTFLVVLLDTTEEQEATSSTELVKPGMPLCGNHNNTRHTQN